MNQQTLLHTCETCMYTTNTNNTLHEIKNLVLESTYNVVNTLLGSTLIFNCLTFSVRRYVEILLHHCFNHILTKAKFRHVTSTYYPSWTSFVDMLCSTLVN